jgi:hypothetical protein
LPQPSGSQQSGTAGGSASGTAQPGGAQPGGGAQTPEERRAAIDRRLDESLGKLDEQIRREQERTAQERDARAASGSAANPAGDTDAEGDGNDAAAGTAETEVPGTAGEGTGPKEDDGRPSRPGDLKSDKQRKAEGSASGSSGGAQGSGATATEIPDGSDDDIVARRLRKAAEQETDPELKEKLWKEYIEYKKNAGK